MPVPAHLLFSHYLPDAILLTHPLDPSVACIPFFPLFRMNEWADEWQLQIKSCRETASFLLSLSVRDPSLSLSLSLALPSSHPPHPLHPPPHLFRLVHSTCSVDRLMPLLLLLPHPQGIEGPWNLFLSCFCSLFLAPFSLVPIPHPFSSSASFPSSFVPALNGLDVLDSHYIK